MRSTISGVSNRSVTGRCILASQRIARGMKCESFATASWGWLLSMRCKSVVPERGQPTANKYGLRSVPAIAAPVSRGRRLSAARRRHRRIGDALSAGDLLAQVDDHAAQACAAFRKGELVLVERGRRHRVAVTVDVGLALLLPLDVAVLGPRDGDPVGDELRARRAV